jgi:hypothetical protein
MTDKCRIYTNNLRKKLQAHMEKMKFNTYQIESRTGVHRQIVARLVQEDYSGLSYENGMAIRTYLQQVMKSEKNSV